MAGDNSEERAPPAVCAHLNNWLYNDLQQTKITL